MLCCSNWLADCLEIQEVASCVQQAFEDVRCVDSSKVPQPKYGVQVDRTDHKDVRPFWQLPPMSLSLPQTLASAVLALRNTRGKQHGASA